MSQACIVLSQIITIQANFQSSIKQHSTTPTAAGTSPTPWPTPASTPPIHEQSSNNTKHNISRTKPIALKGHQFNLRYITTSTINQHVFLPPHIQSRPPEALHYINTCSQCHLHGRSRCCPHDNLGRLRPQARQGSTMVSNPSPSLLTTH
jgi:hypothetical protein